MTEIRQPEPRPAEVVVATAEDVDCGEVRKALKLNACPVWCPGAALHPGWLHGSAGHEMIPDSHFPAWIGDVPLAAMTAPLVTETTSCSAVAAISARSPA